MVLSLKTPRKSYNLLLARPASHSCDRCSSLEARGINRCSLLVSASTAKVKVAGAELMDSPRQGKVWVAFEGSEKIVRYDMETGATLQVELEARGRIPSH